MGTRFVSNLEIGSGPFSLFRLGVFSLSLDNPPPSPSQPPIQLQLILSVAAVSFAHIFCLDRVQSAGVHRLLRASSIGGWGEAQPGHRFVSRVRACAQSGCLVRPKLEIASRPSHLFPFFAHGPYPFPLRIPHPQPPVQLQVALSACCCGSCNLTPLLASECLFGNSNTRTM
jgi:hypothetical protein